MTRSAVILLALLLAGWLAPPAAAGDAEMLVNRAGTTIERLRHDQSLADSLDQELRGARAVLIIPSFYKGGFVLGGAYGVGVLLARGPDRSWSAPAFYDVSGGSIGLQIGLESSEIVFAIRGDKGLEAVMNDRLQVGAGIGLAVLTVGAGMQAGTTTNLGADIVAFATSVGLFGGGALEGLAINPKYSYNSAYYHNDAMPDAILLERRVDNHHADKLRDLLGR